MLECTPSDYKTSPPPPGKNRDADLPGGKQKVPHPSKRDHWLGWTRKKGNGQAGQTDV